MFSNNLEEKESLQKAMKTNTQYYDVMLELPP